MLTWPDTRMLCTECHVRKGPELVQVGFDPAALFDTCEINREISLDKYGIKRSRKSYSTNSFHSSPYEYLLPCENDKPLCKCKLFSDSHGSLLSFAKPCGTATHLQWKQIWIANIHFSKQNDCVQGIHCYVPFPFLNWSGMWNA